MPAYNVGLMALKAEINMKKIIMKVGLIIMALTTMVTMNACSKINNETANDVCTALSEKYGESFVAVKIGDRFNTDSAKLYVHPADNETLVFSARINKDSGKVEDNYIRAIVANEIKNEIKSKLASLQVPYELNVSLLCHDASDETNAKISVEDFANKYSLSGITIYLPIKSSFVSEDAIESIVAAFKETNEAMGISVSAMVYSISDEQFDACVKDMSSYPDLTNTWFDSYDVQGTAIISVKDGVVTPRVSEIIKSIDGE